MRKQIAIDLHDDVGQLLSAARMQIAAINYEAGTSEIKKKINSISQDLLHAIQSTRSVIFNLSPPQINEIGLYAAIHDWMKEQIENKHGIKTKLTGANERYFISEDSRFLIFRSLRELMINVVKHANARHLNINIKRNNRVMEITVWDDGVGFDKNLIHKKIKSKTYGLFSIQERMSDIGGSMEINSKPGIGTKVKLIIPVGGNQDESDLML
jgi:signal transduction histidine kinase